MSDVEAVVRFFAVAEYWRVFGGDLRAALDRFMLERYQATGSETNALSRRFLRALDICERIWGDLAFHRFDGRQWRDQMIGGVYDAQMVAVDLLTDDQLAGAIRNPNHSIERMAELFANSAFDASVRLSTNTSTRVRLRVEAVRDLLLSMLN